MGQEQQEPDDPTVTDPDHYRVVFENEWVRVLEYEDQPGTRTHPHHHPDSVMYTLSGFERRISSGDRVMEVVLGPGETRWLPDQVHVGENTGTTPTHAIFVELKETAAGPRSGEREEGGLGATS